MERAEITQEVRKTHKFRVPRVGIALLAAIAFIVACDEGESQPEPTATVPATPVTRSNEYAVPNKPNSEGKFGPSARSGTCAPFGVPNWVEHKQVEFRCVDPSDYAKELRIALRLGPDSSVTVDVHAPGRERNTLVNFAVPLGQNAITTNPLNADCTIEVSNPGQQPSANQTCTSAR